MNDRVDHSQRAMGSMTDWTREVFTMDEPRSKGVTETFCRLYEAGLIYRDTRLVNWCPALKTAISDIEVETKSLSGSTMMDVPNVGK